MKKHIFLLILISLTVATGCKKKKNPAPDPGPPAATAPGKATLTFPVNNSACTDGRIVSSSESGITFKWNASANTTSYELTIKNLLTNAVITQTTTQTELEVVLPRNTPFGWFVVSKSTSSSASTQSDSWKFYNSGLSVNSHAPFPAEALSPTQNQTISGTTVTLSWKGADADNDISGYDVFFGKTANPELVKQNTTATTEQVSIQAGNTYFWHIRTRDGNGNTSLSELYYFKVN